MSKCQTLKLTGRENVRQIWNKWHALRPWFSCTFNVP